MATPHFYFLKSLVVLQLCLPFSSVSSSIHELLESRGLPSGLLPKEVKSYTLSDDGFLQVYLDGPCLAKFESRVYYDSIVKANLSYGELVGVQGLSQEELFVWLPVKDIILDDPSSGVIVFDVGAVHKELSLSLFEEPPECDPTGDVNSMEEVKMKGQRMRDA
uniref:Uncharacterized protein n=1 Tax=Kalanchoe fedtschenkoi TaxID=63787 RepID=A0A7N0UZ01_KALFE